MRYDYQIRLSDGADDDGVALTATATQCCSTNAAIDAFCNLFAEEAEIIHVGYQLVVRKKGE